MHVAVGSEKGIYLKVKHVFLILFGATMLLADTNTFRTVVPETTNGQVTASAGWTHTFNPETELFRIYARSANPKADALRITVYYDRAGAASLQAIAVIHKAVSYSVDANGKPVEELFIGTVALDFPINPAATITGFTVDEIQMSNLSNEQFRN